MYGRGSETRMIEQINDNFAQMTDILEGDKASERNVEIRLIHVWGESGRVHDPIDYLDILILARQTQGCVGNFLLHVMVQPKMMDRWVQLLVSNSPHNVLGTPEDDMFSDTSSVLQRYQRLVNRGSFGPWTSGKRQGSG